MVNTNISDWSINIANKNNKLNPNQNKILLKIHDLVNSERVISELIYYLHIALNYLI